MTVFKAHLFHPTRLLSNYNQGNIHFGLQTGCIHGSYRRAPSPPQHLALPPPSLPCMPLSLSLFPFKQVAALCAIKRVCFLFVCLTTQMIRAQLSSRCFLSGYGCQVPGEVVTVLPPLHSPTPTLTHTRDVFVKRDVNQGSTVLLKFSLFPFHVCM